MKMLLTVNIPHQKFNAAVKDGTAGKKMAAILETCRPEAAYFTEQEGKRGAVLVIDVAEPSRLPSYAEPWFLNFEADCRFRIVMTPDDLRKAGLEEIGRQWG